MQNTFFTVYFILISYLLQAQSVCEDVDKALHLAIISKEFKNLPSDSILQKLEKEYFPLTSLATCLSILEADITDEQETEVILHRVSDIALRYIEADTLILLAYFYNTGKVTEIFNVYARKYKVRYINMGPNCCILGKALAAMQYFNEQIEGRLIEVNGKAWKANFHAELETYYDQQLNKLSRKERKKIKKNNNY